ncbi:DUF99 family protein [Pokkaliibacter sp. CJK22405]|uniref:endonuclease dU n=1 Tax=Pokkaliibacter sp. CJK22405 TaxID=3384615 RepID=UPI0039846977
MMNIERAIERKRTLRTIGIDDMPFNIGQPDLVSITGIICTGTRFEGMLKSDITQDGMDATQKISQMILNSKFYRQLHAVLIDGITLGGFNTLDLSKLSEELKIPCIAVMRKAPDMDAFKKAIENLPHSDKRFAALHRAGDVLQKDGYYFQVKGCSTEVAAIVLAQSTLHGKIPECLRMSHLINSALATGESSNSA